MILETLYDMQNRLKTYVVIVNLYEFLQLFKPFLYAENKFICNFNSSILR